MLAAPPGQGGKRSPAAAEANRASPSGGWGRGGRERPADGGARVRPDAARESDKGEVFLIGVFSSPRENFSRGVFDI